MRRLVNETQRKAIYALLAKYGEEIGVLQKQIDELTEKRDEEVRAVLSEEQQKEVDALTSYCQLLCSRNLRQRRLWVGSSC